MVFLAAGTSTSTITSSNLIQYLTKMPYIVERLREDLIKKFGSYDNLIKTIDYESALELPYVKYCINESLRIIPPLPVTFTHCFNETVEIGKYRIKKDDKILIGMAFVHLNP